MSIFGAYLEDYHFIKVIIPKDLTFTSLVLKNQNLETTLSIFKEEVYAHERHLYTSFLGVIELHMDYDVIVNNKHDLCIKYQLFLGKITKTKRFDIENYTDKQLGVIYQPDETIFRIWSPVAKEIILVLNDNKIPLVYTNKGVWEMKLNYDVHLAKYYYLVRVNDQFIKTLDPYATSTSPNFEYNIVIDSKRFIHMKYNYVSTKDPIIDEINIRDLTSKNNGGTFADAVISINKDYGLGHLKKLGINCIQLMPVFGFAGVNEVSKNDYNWGYNPVAYFSISNYLTKDFDNPYGGINELRYLIDQMHLLNFSVTMDVVFNHVYDAATFPFDILVPGYAYHYNQDGFMTSASGCGNDLNTTKKMVRRFISDCINYYQMTFKFDGFRFDLMNLIDVDTLNLLDEQLKNNNQDNLMYGEGWNMPMELPKELGGLSENFWELPHYAFFNDSFRNLMKSNFDCSEKGFCLGGKYDHHLLYSAFTGFCTLEERWSSPRSSINYVECHDNHTFFDAIKKLIPNVSESEIIDRMILGLGCVILAQGIPFIHLGQEIGRSKQGFHNSYNLGDEINGIDYCLINQYQEVIDALNNLIKLRSKYDFFRLTTADEIKKTIFLDSEHDSLQLRYCSDNTYVLIVKNDYKEEVKYFAPNTSLIFDGRFEVDNELEMIKLTKPGLYLFKK